MSEGLVGLLLVLIVLGVTIEVVTYVYGGFHCPGCREWLTGQHTHNSTEGSSWFTETKYRHFQCRKCGHKWKKRKYRDINP
jgi:hypothetical protein